MEFLREKYTAQSADSNVFYRATALLFWKDFAGRFWGSDEGKSIDLEELVKLNEASYEDGTPMSPSKFALVLFYFMNSRIWLSCIFYLFVFASCIH